MFLRTTSFGTTRVSLLGAALLAGASLACAQGPGRQGGRGTPSGMDRGMPEGRMVQPLAESSDAVAGRGGSIALGPPSRWWDDKGFARTVGLNPLQKARLDDVFAANRDTLMKLTKNLQHEESQLQKLSRNRALDENQIFQQIDRVTVARGELEKAYAHMLLQIRHELTDEQCAKLDLLQSTQ